VCLTIPITGLESVALQITRQSSFVKLLTCIADVQLVHSFFAEIHNHDGIDAPAGLNRGGKPPDLLCKGTLRNSMRHEHNTQHIIVPAHVTTKLTHRTILLGMSKPLTLQLALRLRIGY